MNSWTEAFFLFIQIKPEKESETNPSSSKAAAEIAQKLNSEGTKKNCAGSIGIPIEQGTDKGCKLVVSKPNLEKTVTLDVSALPGSIQLLRYQFPKKVNGNISKLKQVF